MDRAPTWATRYRENVALLRSGRPGDVHLVAERLEHRQRRVGLSRGEHRMLTRAHQILASEALFGWPDQTI